MVVGNRDMDRGNGTSRPIPDPTVLTNQLVQSAIAGLRELHEARLEALNARIDDAVLTVTRHSDIAITSSIERFDERVKALTEAVAVFKQTVNERFQLGDVQTEKAARDVKSAVDAAFAAAKEAVGEQNKSNAQSIAKSEAATTKQIDQLIGNQQASAKNTDDKIDALKQEVGDKNNDAKDRLSVLEGKASGVNQTGVFIVGAFAVLASLSVIITLIMHFAK